MERDGCIAKCHVGLVTMGFLLCLEISAVQGAEFDVALSGNDENPGTGKAPFRTLTRARDAIRALREAGELEPGKVVVNVHGGIYPITQTLKLSAADGGTAESPVIWQAAGTGEVRFVGGISLSTWQPVSDAKILERLRPEAREHVLQLDLKAAGVTELGTPTPADGHRAELIYNTQYMSLARYPNEGDWLKIAAIPQGGTLVETERDSHYGRFAYDDERPASWPDVSALWMHGYWVHDWSDQYHRVDTLDLEKQEIHPQPPFHGYGYKKGQRFYFLNLLEELDSPGEWFLDRASATIYFWPPGDIEGADIFFPQLDKPMLVLAGTQHVSVRGITFEAAFGQAIVVSGDNNEIGGCTIRNFGADTAVEVRGNNNTVRSCDIYELAGSGILLDGGDRQTLIAANNVAINNHIHHVGQVFRTYHGAFTLKGVGNRIAHCWIHDLPHLAVSYSGNNHIIEYCEIERIAQETGDVGATYTSADWTFMGHEFRYNYFHDIHGPGRIGCFVIYPDLPCGGINLHHNIFYDVQQVFHTNSGRAMVIENNLFLKHGRAMSFGVWGQTKMFLEGGPWKMVENLHSVPYNKPPYSTRYPTLLQLEADFKLGPEHVLQRQIPKDNLIRRNVSWGGMFLHLGALASLDHVRVEENVIADDDVFSGSFTGDGESKSYANGDPTVGAFFAERGNVIVHGDPGFGGLRTQDFRLSADSPAWDLGFESIPFDLMGLQVDEYRQSLPTRVATPVIGPESHVFGNELTIQITPSPLPGGPKAVITYTLDGSEPTPSSTVYSEPIRISESVVLKAMAFAGAGDALVQSEIVSETYELIDLGAGAVYLSDVAEVEVSAYPGCWARNKNWRGEPIRLGGMAYEKGLLVHPRELESGQGQGHVVYRLDGALSAAKEFTATIGIDDDMLSYNLGSSTFIVEVLREGEWERVFESDVIKVGEEPQQIRVDIAGAEQLRLITTSGGDDISCDHSVWALAAVR